MSAQILLDTRTATFLELIGNGRRYRVPAYQRDYAWEAEQWEDLWNDLLELRQARDDRHYMGTLVVEATSDRDYFIIDGQQRLATLSILALVTIDQLGRLAESGIDAAANRQRAENLRLRFIGEKDPASLIEVSRLHLNATDDAFYQDYLIQLRAPQNPRKLPKSCKRLWECFQWFSKKISSDATIAEDGAALAMLMSETVARQLLFILITVNDDLNAYTVFETLNARGIELSATDLLKNYLFSRIRVQTDLQALQRRWGHLIETVRQERFPEFLRFHLLCELPKVRSQRLFKIVRDQVRTPEHVFSLMTALEARAELFAALTDVSHEYWIDLPAARPAIRELSLFRVKQITPLVFAAWETMERGTDFVRILSMLSTVTFRHTVVGGRNPNELESVYHRAAKALFNGIAKTPSDVFNVIREIYVEDAVFQGDFERWEISTAGQSKRLAKFVLCRLEAGASGRACDFETDPSTIEHILPENPSAAWDDLFDPERQRDFTYRVGNLTLLEAGLNRRIGNGLLLDKRDIYAQSHYELTRSLASTAAEEWTPSAIDVRQRDLAKRARHAFRVDFTASGAASTT